MVAYWLVYGDFSPTLYNRVPLIRHSDSSALEDDSVTFDLWLCGLYSAHQAIILASEGSKDELNKVLLARRNT